MSIVSTLNDSGFRGSTAFVVFAAAGALGFKILSFFMPKGWEIFQAGVQVKIKNVAHQAIDEKLVELKKEILDDFEKLKKEVIEKISSCITEYRENQHEEKTQIISQQKSVIEEQEFIMLKAISVIEKTEKAISDLENKIK